MTKPTIAEAGRVWDEATQSVLRAVDQAMRAREREAHRRSAACPGIWTEPAQELYLLKTAITAAIPANPYRPQNLQGPTMTPAQRHTRLEAARRFGKILCFGPGRGWLRDSGHRSGMVTIALPDTEPLRQIITRQVQQDVFVVVFDHAWNATGFVYHRTAGTYTP